MIYGSTIPPQTNGLRCQAFREAISVGYVYDTITKVWSAFTNMGASGIERFYSTAFTIGIVVNNQQNSSFRFYPNPSNGKLFIDFESAISENLILHLYSLVGELVCSKVIPQGSMLFTLDLSESINNGLYSIVLQGNSGMKVEKIVVSK
jgi:hypothetical protein